MPQRFVDCAIPVSVDKLFTYSVPTELEDTVQAGIRVLVPFRKRTVVGIVIRFVSSAPVEGVKPVLDILDRKPIIPPELMKLAQWIGDYYFAPLGEVMKSILVQGSVRSGKRMVRLIAAREGMQLNGTTISRAQAAILDYLRKRPTVSVHTLQQRTGIRTINAVLNRLGEAGIVTIEEQRPEIRKTGREERVITADDEARLRWMEWRQGIDFSDRRIARQASVIDYLLKQGERAVPIAALLKATGVSLSVIRTLAIKNLIAIDQRSISTDRTGQDEPADGGEATIIPNSFQSRALEQIREAVTRSVYTTFLLHGITGSGKTQVYIEAIKAALAVNRTAIVLVPEIALTPQMVRRFRLHFGDAVLTFHSRMSESERHHAWRRASEGSALIVIGPRSALFAPLKNLGLIVVDEEHEPTYKQYDQTPRYHARDVAVVRGSYHNAVVILGSATPSLESYANATEGKYTLLELPERVDNARLPPVSVVDMTEERKREIETFRGERKAARLSGKSDAPVGRTPFNPGSISMVLREKIADRLGRGEGIILLQNRRGFSPFIECPECGHCEVCDHCSISMTYHITHRHLRCHYCGTVKEPPLRCPQCGSPDIRYHGFGTQRVEDELRMLFPSARILRMDLDTTTRKGSHHALLRQFATGEADILLGTQMVAKGLDFPRVTLVGVISADTQMLLPDFRSAERTFQLITQVAGRAGRSSLGGEVIVQTFQPGHYAVRHAQTHDFKGFYTEELHYREELRYPPFARLALVEFRGREEECVIRSAQTFAGYLRTRAKGIIMLGPSAAAIGRLRGHHRWHLLLKSPKESDPGGQQLHEVLRAARRFMDMAPGRLHPSVNLIIDMDPHGLM